MENKIKAGQRVFVTGGTMAGTHGIVTYVHEKDVYMRHAVTKIEFRCKLSELANG